MRKLAVLLSLSLDGYYEGEGHDISWHRVDDEFNDYAIGMLNGADYLLMGRVTYQGMAGFWPDYARQHPDDAVARLMNTLPKLVASTTLQETTYENSRLLGPNVADEIRRLKAEPGECILVLGSGKLADFLRSEDLIDEYHIILTPVLLGKGTLLFQKGAPANLELVCSWQMKSGNMMLRYRLGR